jgi:hypothetical protein
LKRQRVTDSLLIALFTALLIWPLFRLKYMDNWPSIESTFISDARMLLEHWPHTGWQPLWYCGTRFDYVYPPALRYGPALLAKAFHMTTARAYHLYTAVLYVFGIVSVYWLVLVGSRSRRTAILSSAAAALVSPSFLFLPKFRLDSVHWVPQRLHVLMLYGEGPHISALSILPAALAASFMVLRRWHPVWFAAASVLAAAVVAHNFYGATAIAAFFPILAWCVWAGERDGRVWLRAAGIAALAYGLSAIWLTPSYIWITLTDLKWISLPGNSWSTAVLAVLALLFGAVTWRLRPRGVEQQWTLFVAGIAGFFLLDIAGLDLFGFHLAGDTARLIPELDLALILGFFEVMRRLRSRAAVVILTALFLSPSIVYLRYAWFPFPKAGSIESTYPYQIAKWVHDNLPGERLLPSGEVRFWFDAWFDNPQMDGGSKQGLLNQNFPWAHAEIHAGEDVQRSVQWLQAMGTDGIIVADVHSREPYTTDFSNPGKFRGALPVLFDDQQGTAIYRVPRIYPTIGRVVDRARMAAAGARDLSRYVAVVEHADQPITTVAWKGFDEVTLGATAAANQSVLLQETYDAGWHAYEQGKEIPIRQEPVMDFMLVDVAPGAHTIQMRFETPTEYKVGAAITAASVIAVLALISSAFRKAPGPDPAALASSAAPAPSRG